MRKKLERSIELTKELDRAVYKLYIGYPPDGPRYIPVSNKAVQLLKGINDKFQILFEEEIHPDIYRMKLHSKSMIKQGNVKMSEEKTKWVGNFWIVNEERLEEAIHKVLDNFLFSWPEFIKSWIEKRQDLLNKQRNIKDQQSTPTMRGEENG